MRILTVVLALALTPPAMPAAAQNLMDLLREPGTYPTIALGETKSGSLTDDSPLLPDQTPYQPWTFEARAGEIVEVEMATDEFDAYLAIGSENGTDFLERDDDSGGGLNALVTFEVPADGRYVIVANAIEQSARGSYTLRMGRGRPSSSVDEVLAEQVPRARRIRTGEVVTGVLDRDSEHLQDRSFYDVYSYDGHAGDRITVTLRSDDFDAHLGVGLAGSEFWIQDDDSGGGTDSRLVIALPEDGVYGIVANTLSPGSIGEYTLTVEEADTEPVLMTVESLLTSDAVAGAEMLTPDRPVAGTLEETDHALTPDGVFADIWRFRGSAGDRVTFTLESGDFDAFLYLGDTRGAEMGSDDDGFQEGDTDAQLTVTIPRDGEYLLVVRSYQSGATGAYLLRSSVTPASEGGSSGGAEAGTMAMPVLFHLALGTPTPELRTGEPMSAILTDDIRLEEDGSPVTPWVLSGKPGETVVVTLESSDFDTYLVIGAVEGGQAGMLGSDDDGGGGTNSRLEVVIPSSGRVVVLVNSYDEHGGSYTLRAERAGAGGAGDIAPLN